MRVSKFPLLLLMLALPGLSLAEEQKSTNQSAEAAADQPTIDPEAISINRKAKLTEEQAINQLKYMMVSGWAKIEEPLVKEGKFNPLGLVLYPDGTFKPMYLANQDAIEPALQLALVAKQLEAVALSRAVWGVGLMYAQKTTMKDGTDVNLIMVNTEHIAGWGRHWAFPYYVDNGELKLGQPKETATPPFYFVPPEKREQR